MGVRRYSPRIIAPEIEHTCATAGAASCAYKVLGVPARRIGVPLGAGLFGIGVKSRTARRSGVESVRLFIVRICHWLHDQRLDRVEALGRREPYVSYVYLLVNLIEFLHNVGVTDSYC